jgi:AraC family transcriptional regulator
MAGGGGRPGRRRWPPESCLHFIRPDTGEPVSDALADSVVHASSRALGWDGVVAEIGESRDWKADDLALAGHLAVLNVDSRPLIVEWKGPRGYYQVRSGPGGLWIHPAQASFTNRGQGIARWAAVEVSSEKVRRVLGHDLALRPTYGVVDEPLAAVIRALAAEAGVKSKTGPLFADGLTIALVSRLAILSGAEAAIGPARALVPRRLKTVLERIEDLVRSAVTVDELAAMAGLSPAHFAREFKRCTRETPHAFLTRRRLERAREALVAGRSIAETASDCGFCDQAHLSRLFKQRFGVTPGAFVRRLGGRRRDTE